MQARCPRTLMRYCKLCISNAQSDHCREQRISCGRTPLCFVFGDACFTRLRMQTIAHASYRINSGLPGINGARICGGDSSIALRVRGERNSPNETSSASRSGATAVFFWPRRGRRPDRALLFPGILTVNFAGLQPPPFSEGRALCFLGSQGNRYRAVSFPFRA
jgi:hypothetical protein